MNLRFRVIAGGVLAAALAGCHTSASSQHGNVPADGGAGTDGGTAGGGGGTTNGGDPTTPDGFCLAFYGILIDFFSRCDGVPLTQAHALVDDPLLCQRFDASVAAHRSAFDSTQASACLGALKSALVCDGTSTSFLAECKAIAPLVPVGGTCKGFGSLLPLECMGGSYCQQGPNASCDGTCTAPASVGQPCDLLNDVRCAANLLCDSTSKICIAPPPPGTTGASCDDKSPCAKGFYCDTGADAGGGATGTCQPRKSSGPCKLSTDCALPAHCAGPVGSRTCSQPKHAGDSCTPGQNECDLVTFCDTSHMCSATYAAIGQPCGPQPQSDNIPCVTGAYCDATILQSGTCHAIKQPGDACTGALFECGGNSGHCDKTTHQCVACPI